jgi:hypothetical protein
MFKRIWGALFKRLSRDKKDKKAAADEEANKEVK